MVQIQTIGKMLVVLGGSIALTGLVVMFSDKIPFLGKLPGDINIKNDNVHIYVPIATSIVISFVVSLVFWVISLLCKK